MQADPLVGTDAFWITRPIPSWALLAAKVIFLGGVVAVVPIVAESVVMIAYRVPLADVSRVAAQNAVAQMLWLMIMMAAASVTPTLARYALLFAGAAIGLALLEAVTQLIQTSVGRHVPLLPALPEPANPTASLLLLLLLTAAALGMTAVQYATRSWVRAVPVGVVAVDQGSRLKAQAKTFDTHFEDQEDDGDVGAHGDDLTTEERSRKISGRRTERTSLLDGITAGAPRFARWDSEKPAGHKHVIDPCACL